MKIFFIADLHLNKNYLDSYNLFVQFLNNLPANTKSIYILGDLFEFWVDDNFGDKFLSTVKQLLKNITNKIPIYIIKGNRDFLLGTKFALETGTIILPDIITLNLYGNKVLLLHGDFLCAKDFMHIYFTKFIRHPISIFILNKLPIWLKLMLAATLRRFSFKKRQLKQYIKEKLKKPNTPYVLQDQVCQNTVNKLMQQHGTKILIHGHTHKPHIHNFTLFNSDQFLDCTRIVLGDWHNQAKILEFTPAGYELKNISI